MGAEASFTREFIPEFNEFDELRGVSDAEVAKDNQEFLDYMKTLNLSGQGAGLLTPTREPTSAEKSNMPVAESWFASPEAPVALAEI